MRQIKVQELERDAGDWNHLSVEQIRDRENGLRHLAMMGRYRYRNTAGVSCILVRRIKCSVFESI